MWTGVRSLTLRAIGAAVLATGAAGGALAQGNSAAGQTLFNTTLSSTCEGCHSSTNAAAANSLTIIRNQISARSQPGGLTGTLNFAKVLEALDAALLAASRTNTIPRSVSTTNFGRRANKSKTKAHASWQC